MKPTFAAATFALLALTASDQGHACRLSTASNRRSKQKLPGCETVHTSDVRVPVWYALLCKL
jgi:hypothetical protein